MIAHILTVGQTPGTSFHFYLQINTNYFITSVTWTLRDKLIDLLYQVKAFAQARVGVKAQAGRQSSPHGSGQFSLYEGRGAIQSGDALFDAALSLPA
jgi:hypothetical protein